jgi:hypothetical protein
MSRKARVNWERIRLELLSGATAAAVGARYGIGAQTIRNKASRERWGVTETKVALLSELGREKAKEIELALDEIGARLKGSSLRARVKMAQQVEEVLTELEEDEGLGAVMKSRCLASLAQVCEKVHRWSSEPTAAEMEGMKTAAINLTLIRTTPAQLRERAHANAKKGREVRATEGRVVEEAGNGTGAVAVEPELEPEPGAAVRRAVDRYSTTSAEGGE